MVSPLQRPHYVDNALIHMLNLGVVQRARVSGANMVEDSLLTLRLIDWKTGCFLKLANRLRSLCTLVDESNNLLIQFINLLPPVGDFHAVALKVQRLSSRPCSSRFRQLRNIFVRSNDKWRSTETPVLPAPTMA